jgi:hypothetical protein
MSESAKPYFAMVCLQFGYAGMNLVTKTVLDRGMSHYVLVAYRNAFATAAIAPFALLSERYIFLLKKSILARLRFFFFFW